MSTEFLAIGERLRRLRRAAGQTQQEFAETLGTSHRSYIGYETGKRELPTSIVFKICEISRMTPSWVLTGERDAPDDTSFEILDATLTTGLKQLADLAPNQGAERWSEYLMILIRLSLKQRSSISSEDAKAILQVRQNQ